ncbi:MAG TPA: 6-phosphogluconolactonase, partial [Polyangiaceae bacterium]
EILRAVFSDLCRESGVDAEAVTRTAVGLSGIDFEDEMPLQHAGVARWLGIDSARLSLGNDAIVALWGASAEPSAAMVQHGSGFTAAYRRALGEERLFDHLDLGAQFDLRTEVLRYLVRALDGRAQRSGLSHALSLAFGISDAAQADAFLRGRALWTLSSLGAHRRMAMPYLWEAWLSGEEAAVSLVEKALDDYALAAKTLAEHSGAASVAFGGGLIERAPIGFWKELELRVGRAATGIGTVRAALPPDCGAAIWAAHGAGQDAQELFSYLVRSAVPNVRRLLGLGVLVSRDPQTLGENLADQLLDKIEKARSQGRRFVLGCPGGRSLKTTYQALGRLAATRFSDFSHLTIAMMDDYLVEDGGSLVHCDRQAHFSCVRFAFEEIRDVLNSGLPAKRQVPLDQVWLPHPESPEDYDRALADAGGIDIFLLASGASDGHVAFNGPGSELGSRTRVVSLPESTRRDNLATFPEFQSLGDVPRHGITVGLKTVTELSKEVALVIHGSAKRQALSRLIECKQFDPSWPASVVFACKNPSLWTDQAVTLASGALRLDTN